MRTIAEIKNEMTELFVLDGTIRELYGLDPAKTFDEQFSRTSIESIIFYIIAVCAWTLETLFIRHKQEIKEMIDQLKPHTARWYAQKARAFQYGVDLKQDTDEYDNTGKTDEDVEKERIVKYAAVVEKAGVVYVKAATETDGERQALSELQKEALTNYFKQVKDAGVKLEIVSQPAELFNVKIDIYYDPQIFDNTLSRLDSTGRTVHAAIKNHVQNLPFNGEYRNSALITALLQVEGVVIVELYQSTANGAPIPAKITPASGYFKVDADTLNINPIPYETVSD